LKLAFARDTRWGLHRKIKRDANPFDPAWYDYFAERKRRKRYDQATPERQGHSPKEIDQQPAVDTGPASAGL
jgi:hypothetical protein